MTPETRRKIEAAARDDRVLQVPLYVVMNHFGLSHRLAREVVEQAETRVRKNPKRWAKIRAVRERDRLIESVRATEAKYPGVSLECAKASNLSVVADARGFTRERARQIHKALKALAANLGRTLAATAQMANDGALPETTREQFVKGTGETTAG